MDRNSVEAQEARVWLVVEGMRAQDSDEEDVLTLTSLLLGPTDTELEWTAEDYDALNYG